MGSLSELLDTQITAIPNVENKYLMNYVIDGATYQISLRLICFKRDGQPIIIKPTILFSGNNPFGITPPYLPIPFTNTDEIILRCVNSGIFTGIMDIYEFTVKVFIHEFCHHLGMLHMHQLQDFNNPFTQNPSVWIIDNMKTYLRKKGIREDSLNKYITANYTRSYERFLGDGYDRDSIMFYEIPKCFTTYDKFFEENFILSAGDIIGIQDMYSNREENYSYHHHQSHFFSKYNIIFIILLSLIIILLIII
jgi:hypothetical protein